MPFCNSVSGGNQWRRAVVEVDTLTDTFCGGAEGTVKKLLWHNILSYSLVVLSQW